MTNLPIELHIERLILDGVNVTTPRERALLRAAVETELTRLLTAGGLSRELSGGVAVPSLAAGDVQLTAGGDPSRLGAQIAQAVYDGIGQSRATSSAGRASIEAARGSNDGALFS